MKLIKPVLINLALILICFSALAIENDYEKISNQAFLKLIQAMNSNNYQQLLKYAESNISSAAIERIGGADRYASYLSSEAHFHGNIKLDSVNFEQLNGDLINASANGISKNTELKYRIGISVTADKPHKLTRIGLSPIETEGKLPHKQAIKEISQYIDRLGNRGTFSGSVLVAKDGEVLVEKTTGLASRRFNVVNTPNTLFNLGSMNKMFTSLAILQLVQQGEIQLTTSLEQALNIKSDSKWFQGIQIKHLLSHTSGIGRFDCERGELFLTKSKKSCLNNLKNTKLNFKPGTAYRYSNDGMFILGLILEQKTSKSYEDVIAKFILAPAQMNNSACLDMQFADKPAAIGYSYKAQFNKWRNNLFIHDQKCSSAGGYYSTARDLYQFSLALMDNKIVNKKLTNLAITPKPELGTTRYGFGFGVWQQKGKNVIGHNGSFPGVSSEMDIHLDSDFTVIVLSNHSFAADPIIEKVNTLFGL